MAGLQFVYQFKMSLLPSLNNCAFQLLFLEQKSPNKLVYLKVSPLCKLNLLLSPSSGSPTELIVSLQHNKNKALKKPQTKNQ